MPKVGNSFSPAWRVRRADVKGAAASFTQTGKRAVRSHRALPLHSIALRRGGRGGRRSGGRISGRRALDGVAVFDIEIFVAGHDTLAFGRGCRLDLGAFLALLLFLA